MADGMLEGTGRLLVKGTDLGQVEYEITVSGGSGLKDITGTIYADSMILKQAYDANGAVLVLDTGKHANVLVTEVQIGLDAAPMRVNTDITKP
jgi:hypothetical protein